MTSIVYLLNGSMLNIDEYGTEMLLKSVQSQTLTNSLGIIHFGHLSGKLKYTVPASSIAYIEYID